MAKITAKVSREEYSVIIFNAISAPLFLPAAFYFSFYSIFTLSTFPLNYFVLFSSKVSVSIFIILLSGYTNSILECRYFIRVSQINFLNMVFLVGKNKNK